MLMAYIFVDALCKPPYSYNSNCQIEGIVRRFGSTGSSIWNSEDILTYSAFIKYSWITKRQEILSLWWLSDEHQKILPELCDTLGLDDSIMRSGAGRWVPEHKVWKAADWIRSHLYWITGTQMQASMLWTFLYAVFYNSTGSGFINKGIINGTNRCRINNIIMRV